MKTVKHLLKCYFKHIFTILVASKRQTYRFKSLLHIFLFRNRINRTCPMITTYLTPIDICNNKVDCRKNDIRNKLITHLSVFLRNSRFIFFFLNNAKKNQKKEQNKTPRLAHTLALSRSHLSFIREIGAHFDWLTVLLSSDTIWLEYFLLLLCFHIWLRVMTYGQSESSWKTAPDLPRSRGWGGGGAFR